ncbi:hypothetical protein LOZ58_001506 [Ophidiomyces ophidiicola]|nr:hypothetical protein LOZ58_001506 [Ophidiomyces ophidiicola]
MKATRNNPPIYVKSTCRAPNFCPDRTAITVKLCADKDKWINLERIRWSRYFNIPITPETPKGFPIMTLAVQRALCAVVSEVPNKLAPCLDALYHSLWVESNSEVGKPEGFVPVLSRVLGNETAEKMALKVWDTSLRVDFSIWAACSPIKYKSTTEEVKNMLLANTERAVASGAFGLPWVECTNSKGEVECFFGVDHLGQVAQFLDLETVADKGFRSSL